MIAEFGTCSAEEAGFIFKMFEAEVPESLRMDERLTHREIKILFGVYRRMPEAVDLVRDWLERYERKRFGVA